MEEPRGKQVILQMGFLYALCGQASLGPGGEEVCGVCFLERPAIFNYFFLFIQLALEKGGVTSCMVCESLGFQALNCLF